MTSHQAFQVQLIDVHQILLDATRQDFRTKQMALHIQLDQAEIDVCNLWIYREKFACLCTLAWISAVLSDGMLGHVLAVLE